MCATGMTKGGAFVFLVAVEVLHLLRPGNLVTYPTGRFGMFGCIYWGQKMAFRTESRWVGGNISGIGGICERDRYRDIAAGLAFFSMRSGLISWGTICFSTLQGSSSRLTWLWIEYLIMRVSSVEQ